ncbi:flagellar hook-length control protein FliK [Metabacillus sp. RGM 3146]|uniref:flagellar hook-length control protein FliK n=1 Tax=Metabacillus sp. RGM 3146 TaxID=3401092 RepID=UPI003B99A95A
MISVDNQISPSIQTPPKGWKESISNNKQFANSLLFFQGAGLVRGNAAVSGQDQLAADLAKLFSLLQNLSGKALTELMDNLKKLKNPGTGGSEIALSEDLEQIKELTDHLDPAIFTKLAEFLFSLTSQNPVKTETGQNPAKTEKMQNPIKTEILASPKISQDILQVISIAVSHAGTQNHSLQEIGQLLKNILYNIQKTDQSHQVNNAILTLLERNSPQGKKENYLFAKTNLQPSIQINKMQQENPKPITQKFILPIPTSSEKIGQNEQIQRDFVPQQALTKVEQFHLFVKTQPSAGKVDEQEFLKQFQQLLSKSVVTNSNGTQRLMIRLYPERLGQIQVEISQHDGKLTAKITAMNSAVKDLIESNLHQLKQSFTSQQMQIDKIDVSQSFTGNQKQDFLKDGSGGSMPQGRQPNKEQERKESHSFEDSLIEELSEVEVQV